MNRQQLLGLAAVVLALVTGLFTTGCTPPAVHPDQINEFDGATYDSLMLAQGALSSLRTSVATDFASHTSSFNDAAEAYNKAIDVYRLYRITQNEANVADTVRDLSLAILLLETTLQTDFHVSAKNEGRIRDNARIIRHRAAQAHVSVSDILTELQIAAAVAQTVAPNSPYSKLAQAVVYATTNAVHAMQTQSGKAIDASLLIPILPIA